MRRRCLFYHAGVVPVQQLHLLLQQYPDKINSSADETVLFHILFIKNKNAFKYDTLNNNSLDSYALFVYSYTELTH